MPIKKSLYTTIPLSTRLHSRASEEIEDFSNTEETPSFQSPDDVGMSNIPEESNTRKFGSTSTTSTNHGIMHKFRNGVIVPMGFSPHQHSAKRKNKPHWIKVEISNIMQLFDTTDQMPFRHGQLDSTFMNFLETEAEAAFLSKFRPHIPSQFALRVILQELPLDNLKYLERVTGGASRQVSADTWTQGTNASELLRLASSDLRKQIKSAFRISSERAANEVRRIRWSGLFALLSGIVILAVCLVLSRLVARTDVGSSTSSTVAASTWADVASQALVIVGWVAVWRPAELLLFAWLPGLERKRLLDRISHMHVEVVYGSYDDDL